MSLADEKSVLEITDTLYACTESDPLWIPLLTKLADALQASVVATTYSAFSGIGVEYPEMLRYERDFASRNPWLSSGRDYREGQILRTDEVLSLQFYRRTAFYQEWGRRNRVTHGVGMCFLEPRNTAPPLLLTINRDDAGGPFTDNEVQPLGLLLPHLKRVALLRERILEVEAKDWALDLLSYPMYLIAGNRRIRWMNSAAQRFLQNSRGLGIKEGRLHASIAGDDAAFQRALHRGKRLSAEGVLEGFGNWVPLTSVAGERAAWMIVSRPPATLRRAALGPLTGVPDTDTWLAFVLTPQSELPLLKRRLTKLYGLTSAEADVAVAIMEAQGVAQVAELLSLSANTVKTHLASVFSKTSVRRQSELIRILMELAACDTK